ncbi:uncharacterized protein LOC130621813 [Hydractinia symbiolongicarpus]|uniref:uncharacterized protein LOC130621813 n=1 Tax=Hydractinia symbiolongicarpus TaxID=13093 RepID=UPI00254E59FB|nr:uncharacterized protein LOC130621813 [Hydractinia symbiolongicarpus]
MKFNMVYISSLFLFIVKLHFISSTNMRNFAWRLPYMARQKFALMKDVDMLLNIFEKYQQKEKPQLNKRDDSTITDKSCIPRTTLASTYTHDRGVQIPRIVHVKRCQGGTENPENYQCQPTKIVVQCFRTTNAKNGDDYLGIYSHEACKEKCICNRKLCKDQIIEDLMCPRGYTENKESCQCVSSKGESIFFRNMGIITDWNSDLHKLCRSEASKFSIGIGESFTLSL